MFSLVNSTKDAYVHIRWSVSHEFYNFEGKRCEIKYVGRMYILCVLFFNF